MNQAVSTDVSLASEWHFNGCRSIPGPDWPHRYSFTTHYQLLFSLFFPLFSKLISGPSSISVDGKSKYSPKSRTLTEKRDVLSSFLFHFKSQNPSFQMGEPFFSGSNQAQSWCFHSLITASCSSASLVRPSLLCVRFLFAAWWDFADAGRNDSNRAVAAEVDQGG